MERNNLDGFYQGPNESTTSSRGRVSGYFKNNIETLFCNAASGKKLKKINLMRNLCSVVAKSIISNNTQIPLSLCEERFIRDFSTAKSRNKKHTCCFKKAFKSVSLTVIDFLNSSSGVVFSELNINVTAGNDPELSFQTLKSFILKYLELNEEDIADCMLD